VTVRALTIDSIAGRLTQINRGMLRPRFNGRVVDPDSFVRQDMTLNLRTLLLAAALSLWATATYAAETVTVYKDAT
jgi:hypothetical protein